MTEQKNTTENVLEHDFNSCYLIAIYLGDVLPFSASSASMIISHIPVSSLVMKALRMCFIRKSLSSIIVIVTVLYYPLQATSLEPKKF